MSELLIEEKRRIFTIPLSAEELEQISDCRKGICAAIAVGSTFGLFGGRMALGPKPANLLIKSLVIGSCVVAGALVGSGVALQQSFTYLKSKPTNLSQELRNYSELKRNLAKSQDKDDKDFEKIFTKRIQKLPSPEKDGKDKS